MTLYRATVMDTPGDPFRDGVEALAVESDGGLLVRDGVIAARGTFAGVSAAHPEEDVIDLRAGVLLPGMVDTHVHYPQIRAIAGLGMPLLDWLEKCALPEESRLADEAYAEAVASEPGRPAGRHDHRPGLRRPFRDRDGGVLRRCRAQRVADHGGPVVSDRGRDPIYWPPEVALSEDASSSSAGTARVARYAVTPRFSLSTSESMLYACAELMQTAGGIWFTSHMNENTIRWPRSSNSLRPSTTWTATTHTGW
jgi:guanine deaminase